MHITFPPWRKTLNTTFIPLIKNRDRTIICWGGRGSSKSVWAAKKLIYRCLNEPYFRYILYRKTYATIKDSQWQTIKDIVTEWGLSELFTFNSSPLEIKCTNGNSFICRGGDDAKKLKSIKDPTGVWYEEEIPEEADFITISTSIRTTKAEYLQEIFTINPEVEGDYADHWFWKQFFKDQPDGSFKSRTTIDIGDGKMFEMTYTSHQSTFKDNRWIPDSFKAQLIALKKKNPYYYTIYALGKWGNKSSDGNFYKLFERAANVITKEDLHAKKWEYDPKLPLALTFDFNVHPYITLNIHQPRGKLLLQIDEICSESPKNRTDLACREFAKKYRNHKGGIFIHGDPAGKQEDTRTEIGHNDFLIIQRELLQFRPQMRYQRAAPPVVMRGMFINEIFSTGFEGIQFFILDTCTHTINDYLYLKEASDGTKAKVKVKNQDTGVSYEKYGHTSDANDYLICSMFANEFDRYQKGGIPGKTIMGKSFRKNSY